MIRHDFVFLSPTEKHFLDTCQKRLRSKIILSKTSQPNLKMVKCACGTRAYYGTKQKKPTHCRKCKADDMDNVTNPRCKHPSCRTQPHFNLDGEKRGIYCFKHKEEQMVNVVDLRCKGQEGHCTTIVHPARDPKYRGHCTRCFAFTFPNDPVTCQIKKKTKEQQVQQFINLNFPDFIHDRPLWIGPNCDCTHKRRIDHRTLIEGTLLCIETDEHQHRSYDVADEYARYHDVFMAHGGHLVFIRFNPDSYRDHEGKHHAADLEGRLPLLKQTIEEIVTRICQGLNKNNLLEVTWLHYDRSPIIRNHVFSGETNAATASS